MTDHPLCDYCAVVTPRLHEEIAQLRRDLGVCEELLNDIEDAVELPDSLWSRVDSYFRSREPDMTAADVLPPWVGSDRELRSFQAPIPRPPDPGDETAA